MFDEAAAVLGLGMAADQGLEPMPEELRRRLEAVAHRVMADAAAVRARGDIAAVPTTIGAMAGPTATSPPPASAPVDPARLPELQSTGIVGLLGWLVAAACLVLAVIAWRPQSNLNPERQLASLQSRPGIVRAAWIGLDEANLADVPHRLDQKLTGQVLWDPATNEGSMVFEGLAPNNPEEFQYQLWIFDANRPTGQLPQFGEGILTQRPVDGGVFNILPDERTVVSIDPKLRVGKAVIFAVTVEPPGGVVVSNRDIVTLAVVE